jgi:uncharacterized protein (DUF1800 family)
MKRTFPVAARRLAALLATAGIVILLAGSLAAQRASAVPDHPDVRTIEHVLNRIAFGPRPGDVARIQQMGLAAYIDEQLHPERIPDADVDARLAGFDTLSMSSRELVQKYFLPAQQLRRQAQLKQQRAEARTKAEDPTMSAAAGDKPAAEPARPDVPPDVREAQQAEQNVLNQLMQARLLRAVMSNRQLEEVLTDFWFNHFNVFIGKGQVRQYLDEYERDAIRPHVLGRFRDLLGAVAHSPAMLFYLDNWQSASPTAALVVSPQVEQRLRDPRLTDTQREQILNRLNTLRKNMPKGLNENYGRELMELHTLGVDGGYTQKDVIEVARAFTGWTIDQPRLGGGFVFRQQMHDYGEKTILGAHFPAGGGEEEGERVLDILAKSPKTAHHIAFELAQRFVADQPPASLVDRAARTFLETKGDLREVTRTIITSPEFFSAAAYRAKVKTPLEFVVSAARAVDATVVNAQPMVGELRQLGMPLYGCQPPTGYADTADAWVNTGALLNRMNFAMQLVAAGGRAGRAGQDGRAGQPPRPLLQALRPGQLARAPIQVDVTALVPDVSDASIDHLVDALLGGKVADATRQTLARATTPQELLALALGSPEFQQR